MPERKLLEMEENWRIRLSMLEITKGNGWVTQEVNLRKERTKDQVVCLLLTLETLIKHLDVTLVVKSIMVHVNDVRSMDHSVRKCYECGIEGHYRNECPKLKGQTSKGKAFEMNAKKARKDSSVVTGTFLVNNHYAYILFDTGADLSFISKQFEPLLDIKPSKLENKYSIELANGKLIETREIIHGCAIQLENRKFEIDLLPVELGSFDIVVEMDWLSRNQDEIVCSEKLVRMPIPYGEILSIRGDQSNADLKFVNVMKARKMLRKGYPAFLANVVETKAKERKLEDNPVVLDFPEVFPEDLPGLPPERQVEFRIDLVQGTAPVAKSPYRLAPSEMQELSNQLQELLDK
ncbi:uncharacterized protein LOC143631008, partial [Bidens hawaiensis]|uniref:uncharacterized protein LOC143631008 n=1 Tax=Bidens hawaiensis TaxID=980011 RepID=UPI00404A11DA